MIAHPLSLNREAADRYSTSFAYYSSCDECGWLLFDAMVAVFEI
jgi:hypothetical protein